MPTSAATIDTVIPGLAWYDLEDPNSSALDELARHYRLHELQVEDCRHGHQRAKAEEHEHYIFCVLKHLHVNHGFSFDDFDIFLGADFLITVHRGRSDLIARTRTRIRQEGKEPRLDRIFYMLFDAIVDEYLPQLDVIADEISEVEDEVLERPEPRVLSRIFRMKRRLIELRRISSGMREVVAQLARRERGLLGDDLDPYFRDIYDHLVRTVDLIETYRDLLTGSLDIYLSSVANRTNDVMKVLTIYGTLALPFVIITGFFGMNLPLPWQHDPRGPLYAIVVMALWAVAVLAYFKRKHWF